jgi:hypothetical protein
LKRLEQADTILPFINLRIFCITTKSCPAAAMQAARGRGTIATSALHGVSGQHHAPAALYSRGKDPPQYPFDKGWVSLKANLDTQEKSFAFAGI